jgi:DNA modification methylase
LKLINGDSFEELKQLENDSIDSVVTDPPYGLSQVSSKAFNKCMLKWCTDDRSFMPKVKGFMGKSWDAFVPPPSLWDEVFRVLKPGGHALVFAGSRTQDLMGLSLRLSGFEIRDCIQWIYGSGFPKSLNIGKQLEEWEGWGTALKPSFEPAILVRKPFRGSVAQNVLDHGVGGINVDGCRIETLEDLARQSPIREITNSHTFSIRQQPSLGHEGGRWPSNVLISEDIKEEWTRFFYCPKASREEREMGLDGFAEVSGGTYEGRCDGSLGGPIPKRKNIHPTVKPIDLMRYLCRLITPPGGTILEPFMGSGSTGIGAIKEGFNFIGIEREKEYFDIAKARIEYWTSIDLTYEDNEEKVQGEQMSLFG